MISIQSLIESGWFLTVGKTRYTSSKMVIMLVPRIQYSNANSLTLVDFFTDGGDCPIHLDDILIRTDWIPVVFANSISEGISAIESILARYDNSDNLGDNEESYINCVTSLFNDLLEHLNKDSQLELFKTDHKDKIKDFKNYG